MLKLSAKEMIVAYCMAGTLQNIFLYFIKLSQQPYEIVTVILQARKQTQSIKQAAQSHSSMSARGRILTTDGPV